MTAVQRRRRLEQAEGFLELAMVLENQLPLDLSQKTNLANRALQCLQDIRRPLGHKPYLLFLKGQACRISDRHQDAVNFFEQSRRIDSENIHVYFGLAWCYKRNGQVSAAIESMLQAVELDAECAIAHYNLACYYALDDHLESALLHLSYACELDTEYRERAIFETDFDPIRNDPRFATMTSIVGPV